MRSGRDEETVAWDVAVADLAGAYLESVPPRLDAIAGGLARLRQAPDDGPARETVCRQLHGFAGSGATYGFPRVSELGREGEQLFAAERAVTGEALERAAVILDELRREFASAPAPTGRQAAPGPASAAAPDEEVLLVEAEPGLREGLERALQAEGLSVRSAAAEPEARQVIAKALPAGAILDVGGTAGYALVRWIREQPRGDRPALVALHSAAGFLDKVEAFHCGADAFVDKPIDPADVVRRLRRLLEARRARPGCVLLVDDDPQQAAFVARVLQSAGYEVVHCEDPLRFEEALAASSPDLVLMDIVMPRVDGFALARFMRQQERYLTVPLLFVTARADVHLQVLAEEVGGDDLLVKPVVPWLLLAKVASRIERARLLKNLLDHDALTGLLTHSAFLQRARAAWAEARRAPARRCAWVMVDLDHFKAVNDTHGHPVGDRVLAALGALLRRRLRQADVMGRYGGEEFGVLLEDLVVADAARLVGRLREEFAALVHGGAGGSTFSSTFSAGVAMLEPGMSFDDWRCAADAALYEAKRSGRNRVHTAALREARR